MKVTPIVTNYGPGIAHVDAFAYLLSGSDYTAVFQAAIDSLPSGGGKIALNDRNYTVTIDDLTIPDGASITWVGHLATVNGEVAWGLPGLLKRDNLLRQETDLRDDPITLQLQRIVKTDEGIANPKCLRALTRVEDTDNSQTEYAISGEMENYSDSASQGNTAVSGTAFKYGNAGVFGGHFQSNEMFKFADAASVSPIVGCEVNIKAVGMDDPIANDGTGNRRVMDVIARTNEGVTDWDTGSDNQGDAEIGVGIKIRSDTLTNGYFRNALSISEGNSSITTGIRIKTTGSYGINALGDNTIAHLRSGGSPAYGAIFEGTYTTAAIRVNSGQFVALDNAAGIKLRYNSTTNRIEFYNGSDLRASIRMDVGASGGDMN